MKKFFLPLLLTSIVLGILVPVGQHLKPALPVLLGSLMFFNFYSINVERKHFLRREILIYLLVVLVFFPGLVFIITKHLSFPFRVGLFLAAISPAAISGSIVVRMLEGNMELSVANTVIYNLLSPFSYTVLTKLYFHTSELNISAGTIIVKLLLLVFIPFLLSEFAKKVPKFARPLHAISSYMNFLFLFIVFISISASSRQLQTIPRYELLLLIAFVVIVAIVLYGSGLIFGQDIGSKKALAINMGQKNNSLCIWLALSNFDPLTAIPPTVYIIIHHLINSLLIFHFSRSKP